MLWESHHFIVYLCGSTLLSNRVDTRLIAVLKNGHWSARGNLGNQGYVLGWHEQINLAAVQSRWILASQGEHKRMVPASHLCSATAFMRVVLWFMLLKLR